MPKHKMVLSTTEPNNNIPLVRIIQDDKNSHTFEAEIVEDGQLLQFENEVVFFNAEIGTYKVRDKVDTVFYDSSRVSYQLNDAFLQKVGEFNAWFSFANSDEPESDLFSTMRFTYRVLPGIRKNIWEGNYFWDLQELVDYYKRYKHLIAGIVENKDFSGLIDQLSEIDGRTNQLDNFATASKIDAEQGVVSNKFMTPQRVTQQTSARLATDEEAKLGVNSTKLMTPQATKEFYDANMVTRHFSVNELSSVKWGDVYVTRIGDSVQFNGSVGTLDNAISANNATFSPLNLPEGFRPTTETAIVNYIPAKFDTGFGRVHTNGRIDLQVGMDGSRTHSLTGAWTTADEFPR
ncbi:BppU family phage baseplate upper protein [Enterococcus mundtii]|uniref:BppU family phage baseplate upper protein n=1 Tax=Enterococcus mundtii TaxID=53346 RepID=UPI001F60C2EF|nr:BppU family phage baseplate upper protein [Enterococcus mundtii]